MIYFFNELFGNRVLSYFAKPNFIVYDEWFDNDLKKITPFDKNEKITNVSTTHDFFYKQSNYNVGGSENIWQRDIYLNREKRFNNYYFGNNSEKYTSLSNKKFLSFYERNKNKLKFNITKKIIYSLSIFGFVFILGLLLFFISHSIKNESNIINKSTLLEKGF